MAPQDRLRAAKPVLRKDSRRGCQTRGTNELGVIEMTIYKRDPVTPEWEPAPPDLLEDVAAVQEKGFHKRATASIVWKKVPLTDFPPECVFGHTRDWFLSHGVAFMATHGGEDLILTQSIWHGFPDPPEWGLLSRPKGQHDDKWTMWGFFPCLPACWVMPEESGSP